MSASLPLALIASLALGQAVEREPPPERYGDPRRTVVLSQLCRSAIAERELELYASGTVRIRERTPDGERLRLAELGPDERTSMLDRLAREDLSETDRSTSAPQGDWIERCQIQLSLPGRKSQSFEYDQFGSLSLALSRVVGMVGELAARASVEQNNLPLGYQPRRGDILERRDGARYRVVGLTADKQGVELVGLEQPLTLFVNLSQLGLEFSALLAEKPRPGQP
jgi:hypothetical protein